MIIGLLQERDSINNIVVNDTVYIKQTKRRVYDSSFSLLFIKKYTYSSLNKYCYYKNYPTIIPIACYKTIY